LLLWLVNALLAALVVLASLVRIRQHLVSRGDVLELFLCLRIVRILVRVPLERLRAIRFLDVSGVRRSLNLQYFVEITVLLRISYTHKQSKRQKQ